MAKLANHGHILGTIEHATHSIRYMSDGHLLKNSGFGWKLFKKIKEGINPAEAYQRQANRLIEFYQANPETEKFVKKLHSITGLSKRWKLFTAIELMPDDPDGVWSEVCDGYGDNVHATINEIVELCRLYNVATEAAKNKNKNEES